MNAPRFYIFTKFGDARGEVEALLPTLGPGSAAEAGLDKVLFVSRANQTVVFATGPETALAKALRARKGWHEPAQ